MSATAKHRRSEVRSSDHRCQTPLKRYVKLGTLHNVIMFTSINFKFSSSANSATRVENEIYKCESFDSSSETGENFFIEDEIQEIKKPIRKATKVDMSPEAVMKRQAVYEKWLGGVM